jgi:hypothetical protein
MNTYYASNGPEIRLLPARSATVTVQVYNLLGQLVHDFSRAVSAGSDNVIRIFDDLNSFAKGTYFVHVKGLERPMVQKVQIK